MKIINEKLADIFYNPILRAVVLKWKGYAAPDEYKNVLENTYSLLLDHKCETLVEDMVYGKAVPSDTAKWIRNDYIPALAKSGVRKVAVLLEDNSIRKLYVDEIKESIQMSGMQMYTFKSKKEMEKWVRNIPNLGIVMAEKGTFKHYF